MQLYVLTVSNAGVALHRVSAAKFLLDIKEFIKLQCLKRKGGFLRILVRTFSTMWSRKLS